MIFYQKQHKTEIETEEGRETIAFIPSFTDFNSEESQKFKENPNNFEEREDQSRALNLTEH